MTVVSFTEYTPPPRYDGQSWTQARIEETADRAGTWTLIDTIPLAAEPTPSNPSAQSFTTENATLTVGWYRVSWADADGDASAPTDPVRNSPATSVEVTARLRLMVDAARYPTLTDDELAMILSLSIRPDVDGNPPTSDLWVATHDLNAAAEQAWLLKASKAAGDFAFSEDGQRFDRQQVYDHCVQMSRQYRRGTASVPVTSLADQYVEDTV